MRELTDIDLASHEALALMRLTAGQPQAELRRILAEDLPGMVVYGTGPHGHPASLAAALDGDGVTLEYIAVEASQHGRGVGRALVEALALRGRQIIAETDEDAVGFYRALGFQIADAPEDARWPGVPRYRCVRIEPGPVLVERWDRAHRQARMVGWDFSALSGRMTMGSLPWDFEAECLEALRALADGALEGRVGARPLRVLDMGTGGGERLAGLLAQLSSAQRQALEVLATEGWEDNVPVARERLGALEPAVEVLVHDSGGPEPLPVPEASIDLVMNRHEALVPADAARVLRPGGLLLTQQVDGTEVPEVHRWFATEPLFPEVRPDVVAQRSRQAGLVVEECGTWEGPLELADVEALVEYWGYVPWDVPDDFTVPGYATTLAAIHRECGGGPVRLTARRFRLRARKP